ncbi:MAG: HD domain-containing phosphohydrolase [Bdellovibrionota bacterium]
MAKCTSHDYFSIEVSSLIRGRRLTFDLYVYLPINDRIILLKKVGEAPEPEALDALMKKGLKHFHIKNTDREAYQAYLKGNSEPEFAPQSDEKIENSSPEQSDQIETSSDEPRDKATLSASSEEDIDSSGTSVPSESALEDKPQEFHPGVSPEQIMNGLLKSGAERDAAFAQGKKLIEQVLKGPPSADTSVESIVDDKLAEHATSVAIYTVLFALGLGKKEQSLLQDLVIGSLLHDIGLTQIVPEIGVLPLKKLMPVQVSIFQSHAMAALDLLPELDYTPNKRVAVFLEQHHEKFNGSGYPKHMESFRIDEFAQMIGLADLLDSICRGRYDGTPRNLPEALQVISDIEKQTTFPEYFNPEVFKKVMNWLKTAGAKDYMGTATTSVEQTKEKLMKAS